LPGQLTHQRHQPRQEVTLHKTARYIGDFRRVEGELSRLSTNRLPVDDDQFDHIQQTYRNVSEHAKTLVFWPDDEVEQHGRITLAAKGPQLQF